MGFVKLDAGILDSSIWALDAETRIVWITILAMADRNGLVRATAPGISVRARVSEDRTREALARFEAPDPDDRSGVDEGRRIRRVPGGYSIVNHGMYRAVSEEDKVARRRLQLREAKARERERKRQLLSTNVNMCQQQSTSSITEAEAEADADREGEGPPSKNPRTDAQPVAAETTELVGTEAVVMRLHELSVTGRPWMREEVDAALARSGRSAKEFMAWLRSPAGKALAGQDVRTVCGTWAPRAAVSMVSRDVMMKPIPKRPGHTLTPEEREQYERGAREAPKKVSSFVTGIVQSANDTGTVSGNGAGP
jgi:hypothetical protein